MELKIKNRLDSLLIQNGYVLDFSDKTFENFVLKSVDEDINNEKYLILGTSKGKRLKSFWKMPKNQKL